MLQLIEARSPAHALEVAASHTCPIDLLLTDVIMPGMNGPELATRLAEIEPAAQVLYVSGYPRQERIPGGRFPKTPFSPDQLIRKIRSILDE